MGLLSDGAAFLTEHQEETDGELVEYSWVEDGHTCGPAEMTVVISGSGASVDSSDNTRARIESRDVDFIVRVDEFRKQTNPGIVPQNGDIILRRLRKMYTFGQEVAGKAAEYRVVSDGSKPAFDYGDPDLQSYIIHTKLQGEWK